MQHQPILDQYFTDNNQWTKIHFATIEGTGEKSKSGHQTVEAQKENLQGHFLFSSSFLPEDRLHPAKEGSYT